MRFQQYLLSILSGGLLFFAFYYLFAVIVIYKKFIDIHTYFAIGCFAGAGLIFFELLLTLSFSDYEYLIFHKLKIVSYLIAMPIFIYILLNQLLPESSKILSKVYAVFCFFHLISVPFDFFASYPIRIINAEILSAKFIYHVTTANIGYSIFGASIILLFIALIIQFFIDKSNKKKKAFLICISISLPFGINEILVSKNLINSIYTAEFWVFGIISFIFYEFFKEDRKAHLNVVNLSKELQIHKEELEIKVIERTKELSEEKEKVEELLHNVLPIQIVKEYNETGLSKPVLNENATIVFTDFVSFSKFAEDTSPNIVVDNLDKIFSKFDDIVKAKNLEKLKTIGDSYMFAGGLFSDNNQLEDSLQACFEMVEYIVSKKEEFIKETGYEWALRVGIHTGPVVTGLIGKWRFLYDTWGNTVNIASRLEGASETNRINTSREVYDLLSGNGIHPMTSSHRMNYYFQYRGTLPIKNMNPIEMYFVERKNGKVSYS